MSTTTTTTTTTSTTSTTVPVGVANDPEIIFQYKDQNRTFKRAIIKTAYKRAGVQKVFKYEVKTTAKS